MRPIRLSVLAIVAILAVTLVACGGSSPGASSGGGDGGPAASGSSEPPASRGPVDPNDIESIVSALAPPHATEVSRTNDAGLVVAYESTDFVYQLRAFYEEDIPGTGMTIDSTTATTSGGVTWVFSTEGTAGGSVTVDPSARGGSGSSVTVTVTTGG